MSAPRRGFRAALTRRARSLGVVAVRVDDPLDGLVLSGTPKLRMFSVQ